MPQPFTWLYFLLNEVGKSFNYEDGLIINDDPLPIENTPDGWQDKLVNYGRNTKYFGVFRSFTIPLKFVTEGKRVLRHLYYTFGLEKICNLSIKKTNNSWVHVPYYTGEIDFSKFTDEPDYCTVNVMEGGLSKMLKANEGTAYQLPVSGASVVPVLMEGIQFKSTISYVVVEGSVSSTEFTIGVVFGFQEGTAVGIVTGSSPLQSTSGFVYSTNDDRWVLSSVESTVDFRWKQTLSFDANTTGEIIHIYFLKNTGATIDIVPSATFAAGRHTFDIDLTITLNAGERLFILGTSTAGLQVTFRTGNVEVTFFSGALDSTISTLSFSNVFKQLVTKITGSSFEGESDLLDSRTDLVITCGDAVRRLPNSVIKTTFNDVFKCAYSVLNGAVGIEDNKVKLELLSYFFDNTTQISNLGEVSNLKTSITEDLIYNTVKVGYPDAKYDDLNGREEFNSTQNYKLPITRIVKEWDLISPIRADCYGIEFLRANLTQKKTTDSDSDNDVFMIQVEIGDSDPITADIIFDPVSTFIISGEDKSSDFIANVLVTFTGTASNNTTFTVVSSLYDGSDTYVDTVESTTPETATGATYTLRRYKPKKGPYDTTPTGLISPESIYNVELSPKRNLLRHINYLNSIGYKMDGQDITFQSALKNAELVASIGGVEVSEKANVTIGTAPKLFLPVYFTFDCQVPIDLVELMATNSRGYFSFSWQGHTYKGFPIDISIKPADNDSQEFKLLCCPDVDLSTLINS